MSRVLLLTASFGDGHNQAAFALREALVARGATVKIVDYMDWLHPAVRSFAKFSLMQGVQRVPSLYGLFYKSMSRIEPTSQLQRQLNHLGISPMRRCLRLFDPDIVASTFPTPTGVVSELRAMGVSNVPNVAIVTDYTAHRQWIHQHTDRYFVAAETVKHELVDYGVSSTQVSVTGIPLRAQFDSMNVRARLQEKDAKRSDMDLRMDVPMVLVMGGGGGILGDLSDWETLMQNSHFQFVVVCGHNERMYRRLQPLSCRRIRIVGFTTEVDKWMSMSDLIVTKPGGLTLTEALAMALPVIIFRPIPGQEEQNARYALSTGAATMVQSVEEVGHFLERIAQHPEELRRMRLSAEREGMCDAAPTIAEEILSIGQAYRESRRNSGSLEGSKRYSSP